MTIWEALGIAADDLSLVDLEVERHAALHSLGRLDEADAVYASIEHRRPEPQILAVAACTQLSSLSQRNRHAEALALGMTLLARLGVATPYQDFGADVEARLDELVDWASRLDLAGDLARPEIDDPRARATQRLFSRLLPTAFFAGEPTVVAWIVLESQRMWSRYGPAGELAANLSCVGLVAVRLRGDHRIGHTVGRHVLAVGEARGYEPDTSVLRHRHALHVMPWIEPLENTFAQAQLAREGLLRGGDLQMAGHTSLTLLAAQLDGGRTVEMSTVEIEAALAFAARTGNHHTAAFIVSYRQLARTLLGETETPGGFDDASFSQEAHEAQVEGNPLAAGVFHLCRSLAAALFGDGPALARHTASAMSLQRFVPGYPVALGRLLRALSLADQVKLAQPQARSELLAELDDCRDWLTARAADAPGTFRHLQFLVDAERAWAVDDFRAAVTAFDAAAQLAGSRERSWQRALIAERSAYFSMAHGLERAARASLAEAVHQYRVWGATAKVRELEAAHPQLRPAESPRDAASWSRTSRRSSSSVGSDALDMVAILRASQALSCETNLDRLHAVLVTQLTTLTGATDVLVALRNEDTQEWFLPAAGRTDAVPVPIDEAGSRGLIPITAFRYAERTRQPLLVDDATGDDRFGHDPYLAGLSRCSLLVVPLLSQGSARAVLLLANQRSNGAFTAGRLDAVMMLTSQLIASLGNALLYGSLEDRVLERTRALESANRQLETLSITDALTGLANRRHFTRVLDAEWERALRSGRSITVLMIDVDRFKSYNDHYGHPGGDECLRLVAETLARATRGVTDVACRYGGEEFVVILPEADLTAARAVAERARTAVADLRLPHVACDAGIVTVSVGVAAVVPSPAATSEDLVAAADAALYRAKENGRNRVHCAPE